jgi:hypothetical protein
MLENDFFQRELLKRMNMIVKQVEHFHCGDMS